MYNLAQLYNLAQAGFTCNNCSDSTLNRRLLILQILNFLHDERAVLLWSQAVDTVKEDCPMVIWNQVGLPGLQELLLQTVYHVSWNSSTLGALSIAPLIEAAASTESLAGSTWSLSPWRAADASWCFTFATSGSISSNTTTISLWPRVRLVVDRLLLIFLGYASLAGNWSL